MNDKNHWNELEKHMSIYTKLINKTLSLVAKTDFPQEC